MAASLFLTALSSVHLTLMTRGLDFQTQAKISLTAAVVSGGFAVVLALRGFGVWSLAGQSFVSALTSTVLCWSLHPWRPAARLNLARLRSLFGFSGYLFVGYTVEMVYSKLSTAIIGRLYSAADVGIFSRADGTHRLPTALMTGTIHRASFPIFSAVSQDRALLRRGLRKAALLLMWLNVPAMLGIAVCAEPIVLVLFGDQWLACVPLVRVLCLSGILQPLQSLNGSVLMAQGRSRLLLRTEVAVRSIGGLGLLVASQFGMEAIAWSVVGFSMVDFLLKAHNSGTLLGYSARNQVRDLAPLVAASIGMATAAYFAGGLPVRSPAALLTVQVFTGVVAYVALSRVFRLEAFAEVSASGHDLFRMLRKFRTSPDA